ncbi:relaxase/mobilization nuclease domain-containing protein [Nostoc sp. FACHB-87]|uniref:relaxase/mobilization nuclease domain-containing protein n=1 Tax=Nostocaceae TaxID=1162 RepID=UPI0016858DDE|nr:MULTISPECIES: relaxase/mobilization nuclease domain-containing protein [Nostocaceae]MBD2458268.1 relaxase/mobilization nuclease domain-containing protein [Nostoc sp. FACHB-87]MBD2480092.1 relaxase/mobilization nuclease domain-containing protein [Anabaena sp. FACHB-83]
MIGKQTKGRGFRKLLDYLHNSENAKLIGGNMSGRNPRELASEFRLSRQLNPDAERVVYHVSLSAAKDDVISEDKWCEIGNRYMKEMGFDVNQYAIFRHENTDDDHVHIAASRIRMDTGLLVDDSWDYVRSEKVLRQIEIDYDLVQVQGSREKLNRTQSTGQFRRIQREQEEYSQGRRDTPPETSVKESIQQTIDRASVDNPQMPELIVRLQQAGISVRTGFTRNGKSKGISYQKDGVAFSGTQLGAAYTFPGLQKHRGVDYQPERDDERINVILLIPSVPLPIEQAEKFLQEIELKHTQPQFTPPPEDESLRPVLQNYLTQKRGLTNYLVEPLQRQGLGYVDQQENVVFIKRDLNGEKSGALLWDTTRLDNRCIKYPENSDRSQGWFHLKLGGEVDDKIERVILCDSPIEALSIAHIDRDAHKGQPPVRTMYMAVDDPNSLPLELLKNVSRIALAFNNDEQGNETAQVIQKILPQAKRVAPSGRTWNEILIEAKQKEIEQQKQRSRGFSR